MVEGRKTRAPRYLVSEGAVIKFGDRTINCVVRNLSATGAAIEVPNQPGIPTRFELNIPHLGLNLSCRVVWRKDHRIGVTFIQAAPLVMTRSGKPRDAAP
jgi:PilZ domain-containing protein